MKHFIIANILLFQFLAACCQEAVNTNNQKGSGSKTYAVIIGISNYEDASIPALKFANRDAAEFASFLQSKAGGSVPADNIRLLVDSTAKMASVYNALYWLNEVCDTNDLVYFYFAGHGDLESTESGSLGFLLTSNSPAKNYMGNSLQLDNLNSFAHRMAVDRKANVILITDACHSGKLAGSKIGGTFLVGAQLRAAREKEIRITACDENQLSNESELWGGGRGVFSWYLVNGLKGMADKEQDGIISLENIKKYLDSSLGNDPVIKENSLKQKPVIKGNDAFKLTAVDPQVLNKLKHDLAAEQQSRIMPAILPEKPEEYLFRLLKRENYIEMLAIDSLLMASNDLVPFLLINNVTENTRFEGNENKLNQLVKILEADKEKIEKFNDKFAEVLHECGQKIIKLYLDGDSTELEKRQYYRTSNYDFYPKLYALAQKLTKPDNYLYRIYEVNRNYFSAVVLRLKLFSLADKKIKLDSAFSFIQKAMELEGNAANIHNEMGMLLQLRKEYVQAEKRYLRAISIAPTWALPYSNLMGLYAETNNFAKGEEIFAKAISITPVFQDVYLNAGVLFEKKGNLLQAEENYRKFIQLNEAHYLPYERLGMIYMKTQRYEMSDSFFQASNSRKKIMEDPNKDAPSVLRGTPSIPFNDPLPVNRSISMKLEICHVESITPEKQDIIGQLILAYIYQGSKSDIDVEEAEKMYADLNASAPNDPLSFHFLGKLFYKQKKWLKAKQMFQFAIKNYLNREDFDRYALSKKGFFDFTKQDSCMYNHYLDMHYPKEADYFYLGMINDSLHNTDEAILQYRQSIKINPAFLDGYNNLWNLYERNKNYKDAETVINELNYRSEDNGNIELLAFYERMISRFPEQGEWYYKAGTLMYKIAAANPAGYQSDKRIPGEELNKEFAMNLSDLTTYAFKTSRITTILPNAKSTLTAPGVIEAPRTKGIVFLLKADSLLQQDELAVADINTKLGDLYTWYGQPENAINYYSKALLIRPDDIVLQSKMLDYYHTAFQYTEALAIMESLNSKQKLNSYKQYLLARYLVCSGRFTEAEILLKQLQQELQDRSPEFISLVTLNAILKGDLQSAIDQLLDLLKVNEQDYNSMYTLAGLYAAANKESAALKWLEKAVQKGFSSRYVFQYNPVWKKYQNNNTWKGLLTKIPDKSGGM